jgi:putative membrane protein
MLLEYSLRLRRVILGTWKAELLLFVTTTLVFFVHKYFLINYFNIPSVFPTVLGTALAFFIGFNNNQAYDRWWEARKIWGGIVNDSRSFCRAWLFYPTYTEKVSKEALRAMQEKAIKRHLSFLYALKAALRRDKDQTFRNYVSAEEADRVSRHSNIHNALLNEQSIELNDAYIKGCFDGFQLRIVEDMLVRFSDEMGKSERIRNTVFPTTYRHYTNMFIWLFAVTMTMEMTEIIGYWSILLAWLLATVFLTTHTLGETLIDPFDPIPSGISLDSITRTIEINLLESLHEKEIPPPIKSVNGEYIM